MCRRKREERRYAQQSWLLYGRLQRHEGKGAAGGPLDDKCEYVRVKGGEGKVQQKMHINLNDHHLFILNASQNVPV